jgi:hypothetical protein
MWRLNGPMALLKKSLVPLCQIQMLEIGSLRNLGHGLIPRRHEPAGAQQMRSGSRFGEPIGAMGVQLGVSLARSFGKDACWPLNLSFNSQEDTNG